MIFDYSEFFESLRRTGFGRYADELELRTRYRLENPQQGDFDKWTAAFVDLPDLKASHVELNQPAVVAGTAEDYNVPCDTPLRSSLMKLHPWRKGPFEIFGIYIDAEWRSDLKWERISRSITPLKKRAVLDLGCGNGYYLWRMLGEGAKLAMGIDASLLFAVQFQVFQKYMHRSECAVLPLALEDLPADLTGFDTVFSMGLLYHRRDPLEHLKQLKAFLRTGGELVLETLIIRDGDVLKPEKRYAKMGNVWNIPSCAAAEGWLRQAGFYNIRCVDVSVTTEKEQRRTNWMQFESLRDFLNPDDFSKTIEGYPAPCRAIFVAEKI